jgi:PAP2 superfamily
MTKLPLTARSPVAAVPLKALRARALGLLVAAAALFALALPAHGRADAVTEWNLNASNALMVTGGQDARLVVVHLAMVHGAMYDAVNAIDQRYEPYLISKRLATPFDSKDAAAATAAYRVLANIVPAQQPTLAAQHAASLASIPDSSSKTRGMAVGEAAAAAMIAARTEDGRFGSFQFVSGLGAGQWRPVLPAFVSDPIAWLKDVKPFLIDDPAEFRSRGPYRLRSRKYAREFAQVKELGSATSTTRTADQTHAARYWAENPPRTWNRIFQTLSAQEGLSLTENARFFAMLYLTVADAFICVWDDKAHWSFWRPITAIREADTDGNPATKADSNWLPLIPTPPYPDHPSGHAGLSGAAVAALQEFFGTDSIAVTDTNLGGLRRSWSRLSQIIEEVVYARMWSGIHFLNPDEQGRKMGETIARYSQDHYLQPVGHHHAEHSD